MIFRVNTVRCGDNPILSQNRVTQKTPKNRDFCESGQDIGYKSILGCFSLWLWGIMGYS